MSVTTSPNVNGDPGLTAAQAAAVAQSVAPAASNFPSPPTSILVQAQNASAVVSFATIAGATGYVVTASPGNISASGTSSPITVSGLTNGTTYTFTVTPSNNFGSGAASSASAAVIPTAPPSGVAGLFAWYDMSQQSVVSDLTAIAALTDNSGNGWAISQSVGANQPVYRTAANWGGGATGKPAMQFNYNSNTTAFLRTPFTSRQLGVGATIFMVISFTGLTNSSGARDNRLLSMENNRYDCQWYIGTSTSGLGGGGTTCLKATNVFYASNTTSPVVASATPYVVSIVGGQQLFLNGVRASAVAASGLLPEITQKYLGFQIGNINDGQGQIFPGSIAELAFYNTQLSDANRYLIEAALSSKYGLAAPAQNATVL